MKELTINELIGPAREIALTLVNKINRVLEGMDDNDPLLLWGPPGTGKTTVAHLLARHWAREKVCLQHLNGQQLSVDVVRDWRRSAPYRPLFGNHVYLVDEIDAGSKAALGELRTFLDTMPAWCGFVATTNKQPRQLDESIQTRFYDREVEGASGPDIHAWLVAQGAPATTAQKIVQACNGNVRQARLEWKKIADYRQFKKAA